MGIVKAVGLVDGGVVVARTPCCLFWDLKVFVVDLGALVNESVGLGLWWFVNVSMVRWYLRLE